MKKLLLMLLVSISIAFAAKAQEVETKVKKTTTPVQKVHNTFHRHKHYKGYKVKHTANGHTTKRKVNLRTGKTETKKD
ncbi:MAG: hypothetical protein ABJA37_11685 [Ferruginibacter sp.]